MSRTLSSSNIVLIAIGVPFFFNGVILAVVMAVILYFRVRKSPGNLQHVLYIDVHNTVHNTILWS